MIKYFFLLPSQLKFQKMRKSLTLNKKKVLLYHLENGLDLC